MELLLLPDSDEFLRGGGGTIRVFRIAEDTVNILFVVRHLKAGVMINEVPACKLMLVLHFMEAMVQLDLRTPQAIQRLSERRHFISMRRGLYLVAKKLKRSNTNGGRWEEFFRPFPCTFGKEQEECEATPSSSVSSSSPLPPPTTPDEEEQRMDPNDIRTLIIVGPRFSYPMSTQDWGRLIPRGHGPYWFLVACMFPFLFRALSPLTD